MIFKLPEQKKLWMKRVNLYLLSHYYLRVNMLLNGWPFSDNSFSLFGRLIVFFHYLKKKILRAFKSIFTAIRV